MTHEDKPWYHLTADEVAAAFEVEPTRGLARGEARARLGRRDANRLAWAIGDLKDAVAILVISLEKWFWRQKAVSSEARERT